MFIVIEGIDGAGKGRQRLELVGLLESNGFKVDGTEFPDHKGVLYKELIKPFLMEKITLSMDSLFLSFALDQLLYATRIINAKGLRDKFFLCDGFFTTNLVYQCLVGKSIKLKRALKFADDFQIPVPDLNIFIDVDPKIALKRKSLEEGHDEGLDINERDLDKQYLIRKGFLKLAKENVFGHWEVIDGSGSIKEVTSEIVSVLKKHKILS